MKILITGGAGYLALISQDFSWKGDEVIVLDNLTMAIRGFKLLLTIPIPLLARRYL